MRKAQYTVTGKDAQEHTAALLEQKAGLQPTKGKCTLSVMIHRSCPFSAQRNAARASWTAAESEV